MKRMWMLLAGAALAVSATGCGCCGCFTPRPAAVVAAPAPYCPPPVAANPCVTPGGVTYGYAPSTGW